ncbi:jg503 [Pararge aegeria aegeria]|uniref:Jg503 protein n=2 Tax=Pararge aegeria TaxID=116150 RepID=A0A8S4QJY0_9NEOP|nr:jg503 [Pararge aegeria aegeria]
MSDIDLNVLIKFIGTFDGTREKLTPFINNCRNAINLASATQTEILFKYILSRLEGKAETACAVKEFTKWSQLEEFLKTQFGDIKHYAYLLSDLQECKQGRNESVSHYSLRVEACLAKLLTEINISIPTRKKDELAGRVAAMQDLALNVFMIGLQSSLSTVVRCRDPNTLNEAINLATAEEKIVGINNRKYTNPTTGSFIANNFEQRRQNHSTATYSRPQLQPQAQFKPSSNTPVCRYCKNLGHTIENCRKRQYNNNRRFNNIENAHSPNRQPPNSFLPRNRIHLTNSSDDQCFGVDNHNNDPLNE